MMKNLSILIASIGVESAVELVLQFFPRAMNIAGSTITSKITVPSRLGRWNSRGGFEDAAPITPHLP